MPSANRLATLLLVVSVLLALPQPARAKAINVGNGTAASCTEQALRNALTFAKGERQSTVLFKCGKKPITIAVSATLPVPDNTTIDGSGLITLDGQFGPGSILRVDRDTTVALLNLSIARGGGECFPSCEVFGGGLLNEGTVTVDTCTFSDNIASSGGGIFNHGTLSVRKSTFLGNDALSGGGIFNEGKLTVNDSAFTENHGFDGGGGIFSQGTLVIHSSTFAGNGGGGQTPPTGVGGGGIFAQGTLNVANSAFYGNQAQLGGALWIDTGIHTVSNSIIAQNSGSESGSGIFMWIGATLTVKESAITGNVSGFGGGIYNQAGALVVKNSSITENHAMWGGAIQTNGGTVTIDNSTITQNTATLVGGGIASDGMLTIRNSAITQNTAGVFGGGIYNAEALAVKDSTITANTAGSDGGGVYVCCGGTPPTLRNTLVINNTPNDIAP